MLKDDQIVRAYEDLAHIYDRQGQPKLRDWFLVLAADAAFTAGRESEAERLRIQLLSYNPHHLLKPFVSFVEALRSPDIQSYIADLRRTYPPEAAEQLLETHRPGSFPTSPIEELAASQDAGDTAGTFQGQSSMPEEPQIYPMGNGAQEGRPVTPPPRPPTSRPGTAMPRTSHPAAPAQAPAASSRPRPATRKPSPLVQEWSHRAQSAAPREEPAPSGNRSGPTEAASGGWVATALFGLVLAAGLALAVYTFARPFVPEAWLQR